ncbi:aldolase/citrate lyase family protein [Paenibacillus qinlingensis]|uniref:4-hydroxy-2-oxoheptanedioate aldolase n=1 Tax=Paenibacillus qinlingensis TaxID=1837343 RepID=A0ABU1NSQ8_9BACL|nr:aldolase/citrate lyase family protein [Paenibacillus qinlingensis]MDR6550490.1 4-hydroxy-2-oxoheptanedioate aldolase [Paenibacillus qinlingensis]
MATNFHMRQSRVLRKLRAGETAIALKLNLADPRITEMAARISGVDCLWTDMEHVPNDLAVIERQIWAAKAYDVDVLVRVARGSYSELIRPLEMDAAGIMVPHVMSLADAKQIIYHTKFYPIGRRPLDGGNSDGAFCNLELGDYISQANDQRFNVLQIEDPEPLNELEDIIALPGLDMIFFGPGDFSQGIGAPGKWDHPLLVETRQSVARLARKHGKYAGTVGSPSNMDDLVAMGYQFVSVGADVVGFGQYLSGIASSINRSSGTGTDSVYGSTKS